MTRQELLGWWWNRTIDIVWRMLIPVALAGVLYYAGMRIINDRAAVAAGTLLPHQALTVGEVQRAFIYGPTGNRRRDVVCIRRT